jgi:hypothetical protein
MERGFYEEIREKKGIINKRELSENRLAALMHIYDYSIEFSQLSQEYEVISHHLPKDENFEIDVNLSYSAIIYLYNDFFKEQFDKYITEFNPDNQNGLKLSYYDLIIDYLFYFRDTHFYSISDK